eukprot:scaffold1201_cov247-Pinguiococcus_pyrenoidosus.AAC.2
MPSAGAETSRYWGSELIEAITQKSTSEISIWQNGSTSLEDPEDLETRWGTPILPEPVRAQTLQDELQPRTDDWCTLLISLKLSKL